MTRRAQIQRRWRAALLLSVLLSGTVASADEPTRPCADDVAQGFEACLAKLGRFHMTLGATEESRLRTLWHCGFQQGVRFHNDP